MEGSCLRLAEQVESFRRISGLDRRIGENSNQIEIPFWSATDELRANGKTEVLGVFGPSARFDYSPVC